MAEPRDDEFYVGYLPEAPAGIAARARWSVVLLLVLGVAAALLLVSRQQRFDPGVFEYGVRRPLEGVLREKPYPALYVERPGTSDGDVEFSRLDLVSVGKFGAASLVDGLDGRSVRLGGSLIYRQGRTMVEVEDGSIEMLDDRALERRAGAWQGNLSDLGLRTLIGEIVDSKCFLGVMKPGRTKPHKACAIRCISGGIPPMLMVEDPSGAAEFFLLTGENGQAIHREILGFVAEPVEISGRVQRQSDVYILEIDPTTIRRL